jgi:hypothetical protein
VLHNLGEPQQRQNNGHKWLYESTCSCELPAFLSIEFKDGKIIELVLSEEE